ncbi:PAS domain S-box protein [Flavobacterium sp.]|uniref:PAS domain S-box protein n=1 Tax=Flavobacterium sp. TaxID=239 RepID=UPI003751DB82
MKNFQFDLTSFNKLFPFFILIDSNLKILSFGQIMSKNISELKENSFFNEAFFISNPYIENLNFDFFYSLLSQQITIESINKEVILKGQFECYQEHFLFVGSPCLSILEMENKSKSMKNEDSFKSLLLNLQTGILLEDEKRKIVMANKSFCVTFGLEREDSSLIGIDCSTFELEIKSKLKNSENYFERINEIIKNKEIVLGEELELIDGRYIERRCLPVISEGKFTGYLWSYNDVTINKKYKESLNIEKEKYRNIIDNMNIGLLEVDTNDTILLANQLFSSTTGYSIEYLIGKKASDIFLDDEGKKIRNLQILKRQEGKSDSYELTIKNALGDIRQILVSGGPNYDFNGELIGSIGLFVDVTETKNLEIQQELLRKNLEKQNEKLSEYAQIVSHDLKSPLRSIHSLITFIEEDNDKELNAKTANYFLMIQKKVEKMDQLINGILIYSKIDIVSVVNNKIDLNNVVNNIISIVFIPSHIKIIVKEQLPVIKADRYRIQQLFQNLISNAINYNDKPSGIVEIGFEEFKDHYVFFVSDNGKGIALKNHNKIFKIFQSLDADERAEGIGLSIVKRILENANEKIWLESEENKGTTFFFTLHK